MIWLSSDQAKLDFSFDDESSFEISRGDWKLRQEILERPDAIFSVNLASGPPAQPRLGR